MPELAESPVVSSPGYSTDDADREGLRTRPAPRLQLDYIDGMRALAALYIVCHHALRVRVLPWPLFNLFSHGQEVVAVFIVISGFCLALPNAQRGEWKVDAKRFFTRRARRILPPYYAAIALAVVFAAIKHAYGGSTTFRSIWVHLLMIQNWSVEMYTLAGPFWSVAVECQIYLLFPILVLTRRKLGAFANLLLWFALAVASFPLLHARGETIFLGYFAIGIFSAEAAFRKNWRPWMLLCMIVAGIAAMFANYRHLFIAETEWAVFTAALLAYLIHAKTNPLRRLLSWKPLTAIGLFSYSIYLVHAMFLETMGQYMQSKDPMFDASLSPHYMLYMGSAALISLPAAYLFHRAFELPFMSAKRHAVEARVLAKG